jgi:hypothetical protein
MASSSAVLSRLQYVCVTCVRGGQRAVSRYRDFLLAPAFAGEHDACMKAGAERGETGVSTAKRSRGQGREEHQGTTPS